MVMAMSIHDDDARLWTGWWRADAMMMIMKSKTLIVRAQVMMMTITCMTRERQALDGPVVPVRGTTATTTTATTTTTTTTTTATTTTATGFFAAISKESDRPWTAWWTLSRPWTA